MEIYLTEDDKQLINDIITRYHESLNHCESAEKLVNVGMPFMEAMKSIAPNVDFGDIENIATIFFRLNLEVREIGLKQLKTMSNEYEPKYIRIFQRINILYCLYQKRLIVFNCQPISEITLPKIESTDNGIRYYINENKLSQFVKDYHQANILPSVELESYSKNGFVSIEELRFRKERKIAIVSLIVAIIAVLVAIGISIYSKTKLDDNQYNKLIKAIQSTHVNQEDTIVATSACDSIIDNKN